MSISPMKKLSIFAATSDVDPIVGRLIKLKCVGFENGGYDLPAYESQDGNSFTEYSSRLAEIEIAMNTLAKYSKRKKRLLSPRIKADLDEFASSSRLNTAACAVDRVLEILEDNKRANSETASLEAEITALMPWDSYSEVISTSGTKYTSLILGSLPPSVDVDNLMFGVANYCACLQPVSYDEKGKYVRVIVYKDEETALLRYLAEFGFVRMDFSELNETAKSRLDLDRKRLVSIEGEQINRDEKLWSLAESLDDIEVYYDYVATLIESERIKQDLLATRECVCISGWVPSSKEEKVQGVLDKFECAYEMTDPDEGDDVPILLDNNTFASSFEWVLAMYSYPKYNGFDPTFPMSIFFFLIFGMMFADFCYGVLIAVTCFTAIKIMKPADGTKNFLKMFGFCGISSALMGIVFGSYFGDLPAQIASNWFGKEIKIFSLLDPIEETVTFLVICIAFGAVHILTGMALKFYILCKNKDYFGAIFDVASWWVIFAGLGLYFAIGMPGAIVAIIGVLMIICTAGRNKKGFFGKLVGGLGGLYNIISYASDLLSYSRILALGLSSIVIAQVVNILSTMIGFTPVGVIAFILIFLIGHAINIALNMLGAFVHTSRLQYIEFFNKFYEDGGREFKPSRPSEKYTMN